jgi:phosphoribosylaminoimidazole-succinocarboxamide synthase
VRAHHIGSGKVRELYAVGEDLLLMVATDRISAYDVVLGQPIPDKGRVLTALSHYWFEVTESFCPNHCISVREEDLPEMAEDLPEMAPHSALRSDSALRPGPARPDSVLRSGPARPAGVVGRAMLCRRARPIPIEFVVRGYLTGSGWKEYRATGRVCGHRLPEDLVESQRLPQPLLTPATKATDGHDLNITEAEARDIAGRPYDEARDLGLAVYAKAATIAAERGVIIADTKFEFGEADGEVVLIDEVLTPDSSRFWPANAYQPGRGQASFDKQYVRDWLDAAGWDHNPPAPALPSEVVAATRARYLEAYERVSGRPFEAWMKEVKG